MAPRNPEDKKVKDRSGNIDICYRIERKGSKTVFTTKRVMFGAHGTHKDVQNAFKNGLEGYLDMSPGCGINVRRAPNSEEYLVTFYGKKKYGLKTLYDKAKAAVGTLRDGVIQTLVYEGDDGIEDFEGPESPIDTNDDEASEDENGPEDSEDAKDNSGPNGTEDAEDSSDHEGSGSSEDDFSWRFDEC